MQIERETRGDITILTLSGRCDAHGSAEFDAWLAREAPIRGGLVIDMAEVDYLSSAGLGILAREAKRLGDSELMGLANLAEYVQIVLHSTGLDAMLRIYPTRTAALEAVERRLSHARQEHLGVDETPVGVFSYATGLEDAVTVEVAGDLGSVLHARVTPDDLVLCRFSPKALAFGVGGLGGGPDDCAPFLGETVIVGGAMVWRPTDGNDRADLLVPRGASDLVGIRAAHQVTFPAHFSLCCRFRSKADDGAPLGEVCDHLLDHAKRNGRPGVLALALRAEMATVVGGGLRVSPIRDFAPAGTGAITDPGEVDRWFMRDTSPGHRDVTALAVGLCADLDAATGDVGPADVRELAFSHPGDPTVGARLAQLHAALFERLDPPDEPCILEDELHRVVREGRFLDMRRLLSDSRVRRATIGIAYVAGVRRHKP